MAAPKIDEPNEPETTKLDRKDKVEESVDQGTMKSETMGMEDELRKGKEMSDAAFIAFKQGNLDEAIGLFSDCLDLM